LIDKVLITDKKKVAQKEPITKEKIEEMMIKEIISNREVVEISTEEITTTTEMTIEDPQTLTIDQVIPDIKIEIETSTIIEVEVGIKITIEEMTTDKVNPQINIQAIKIESKITISQEVAIIEEEETLIKDLKMIIEVRKDQDHLKELPGRVANKAHSNQEIELIQTIKEEMTIDKVVVMTIKRETIIMQTLIVEIEMTLEEVEVMKEVASEEVEVISVETVTTIEAALEEAVEDKEVDSEAEEEAVTLMMKCPRKVTTINPKC